MERLTEVTLALRGYLSHFLREEDCEFHTNLGHTESSRPVCTRKTVRPLINFRQVTYICKPHKGI